MGFSTRQWLKGIRSRRKGHHPMIVELQFGRSTGAWSRENKVVAEISALDSSSNYLTFYLTSSEADVALNFLAETVTSETRIALATSILRQLDAKSLVAVLSGALAKSKKAK
jgi:hypothetical protein